MKNKMFKIVGAFSFFIAIIALIGSIGLGFIGGSSFWGGVDKSISSPNFTVSSYIKSKSNNETETSKPSTNQSEGLNEDSNKENEEFQKKLSKYFDEVVKSIDNFATTTNQGGANKKGLEQYLLKATKATNRDEYIDYLMIFSSDLKELERKAKEISTLKPDDPQHIKWEDFLSWHVTSYMQNFNNEKKRIAIEELKAQANSAEGLTQLMAAGSIFTVFVLFVLIMLLVQIESNTRSKEK